MPKHAEPAAGVDLTPCNCLALRQAARHISQLYDQHLAEVGLRTTQYSILSKLSRLGAMPIGKLAATMTSLSPILQRQLMSVCTPALWSASLRCPVRAPCMS